MAGPLSELMSDSKAPHSLCPRSYCHYLFQEHKPKRESHTQDAFWVPESSGAISRVFADGTMGEKVYFQKKCVLFLNKIDSLLSRYFHDHYLNLHSSYLPLNHNIGCKSLSFCSLLTVQNEMADHTLV